MDIKALWDNAYEDIDGACSMGGYMVTLLTTPWLRWSNTL